MVTFANLFIFIGVAWFAVAILRSLGIAIVRASKGEWY